MTDATAPSSHLDVLLDAREIRWAADGHLILGGVDLEVAAGTIVGLVGPNGSGKTTLLRAVTRLIEADGGSVALGGTDTTTLRRRDLARQIALVEQHAATGLDLSVLDVVLLGRTPHRSLLQADSSDDVDLARSALADVDMAGTERRRWHTLSGGEQQRVQLARAIVQQPRLLVLDEPTNHLDIGHQLQLLQFVRQAGVTTLAALHDLNLAAMFCDAVVVLDAGRVAAAGPATEVITPSLLADVFGVRADVTQHPATGRPLIVLHPPAPDRR